MSLTAQSLNELIIEGFKQYCTLSFEEIINNPVDPLEYQEKTVTHDLCIGCKTCIQKPDCHLRHVTGIANYIFPNQETEK